MSSSTTSSRSSSDDSPQKNLRRHVGHVVATELARRRQSQRPERPLALPLIRKGAGSES